MSQGADAAKWVTAERPGVPLARLVTVELRKMFDTRSGFRLIASIALIATLATVSVALVVPDEDVTFGAFAAAIAVPMTVLLPIIAILSVTDEWGQRTGLVTFALVPHRGQVIAAKAIASVLVGVVSMLIAFAIGAVGNVVGSALNGVDARWDVGVAAVLLILLGNVLALLIGFMLGVLFRSSAAAIAGYFVYGFVLPTIFSVLAATQEWFADIRNWVDFKAAQAQLFNAPVSGEEWANLAVSSIFWLVLPMAFGIWSVLRAEIK